MALAAACLYSAGGGSPPSTSAAGYQQHQNQRNSVSTQIPCHTALALSSSLSHKPVTMAILSIPFHAFHNYSFFFNSFIDKIHIHKIHPFKVFNSMVLIIFRVVQQSPQSNLRTFHLPKKKKTYTY